MSKYFFILAIGVFFSGCQEKSEEEPSEIDHVVIQEELPWNNDQRNYEISSEERTPLPQESLTMEIE